MYSHFVLYLIHAAGISHGEINEKVNPFQSSSFTCYVEGSPPPEVSDVFLYQYSGAILDETGITRTTSTSSTVSPHPVVFDVDRVVPGDYVCSLVNGSYVANLTVTAKTYGTNCLLSLSFRLLRF